MPLDAGIASNLSSVRRRIHAAAQRANRSPAEITLVAVSKTFGPDSVQEAALSGQLSFGENRVQEAATKAAALTTLDLDWHLIGHLQANKARKAVALFNWIQSVDSLDLLLKLDAAAAQEGRRVNILVQVDLAGEATKFGADRSALDELMAAASSATHLDLRGLMLVPPNPDAPEASRPWFRQLRDIRDELVASGTPADSLSELSMGMSHDFEVAIEEGATIVRVGTAIFGHRDYSATP